MSDTGTLNTNGCTRRAFSKQHEPRSVAIPALAELAKGYTIREIERDALAGKSAIWGGASWEAPLIRACDTIPIGINELWREDSLRAEAIAENHHQIPAEFCSMIKAMVGRLHLKKDGPIKRVLLFGSTCEPIGNAVEHAKRDGYDIHWIDAATAFKPEEKHEELVKFLVKELQKVAVWLTGKPADEDRVREEIKLKNRITRKVRRILELRVRSPFFLASIPTLQVLLGTVHYFGNPEKFDAVLDQSNGVILGWVLTSTSDFREDIPPLESIANYLFDAQVKGELGEAAGASATYRRVRVEELVRETKARGIISSFITGCPYGSVVQGLEREYFKKLGVPMVALETTVHDQPPTEEQITKVKTFLEVLS